MSDTPAPVPAVEPARERRAEPPRAPRDPRELWARMGRARWLLVALVLLYPAYLIIANVVLRTNALKSAIGSSNQLALDYDEAHTWWPGHVTITNARVRIEDKNVQALVVLARAQVNIALTDIVFARTFRASRVKGEGARFYMRHRVEAVDASNAARIAAYPVIPGLDPLPLFEAGPHIPPEAKVATDGKKLWAVELDNVEATVDEVWIQELRYRGRGTVKGGFRLRPLQRVWVGPASLTLESGTLTIEPDAVATDVEGRLDVTVHDFDVLAEKGLKPFESVEARLLLKGKLGGASFMRVYTPTPRFGGGAGPFELDLRFDRGTFAKDSVAHVDLADLVATVDGISVAGPLSLTFRAPERAIWGLGADTARAVVSARDDNAKTKSIGALSGVSVRGEFELKSVAEDMTWRKLEARAKAEVAELEALSRAVGSDVVRDGSATASLEVALEDKTIAGTYDVTLKRVVLDAGNGATATVDGTIKGRAVRDPKSSSFDLVDVRADIPTFSARAPGLAPRGTWVNVRLAKVDFGPCTTFPFELFAGNASVLGALLEVGPLRPLAAEVLRAANVRGRGRMRMGDGGFRLDVERAVIGDAEGKGLVYKTSGKPNGAFLVEAAGLSAGVEINDGDVKVKPLAGIDWFEQSVNRHGRGGPSCPVPEPSR